MARAVSRCVLEWSFMNRFFAVWLCLLVGIVTACGGRPTVGGPGTTGLHPDASVARDGASAPIDNNPMGLGLPDASSGGSGSGHADGGGVDSGPLGGTGCKVDRCAPPPVPS